MAKTQKELAFLRELYVDSEWTERITNFVDKSLELTDEENILYLNAGTGNHAISLREKLDKDAKLSAASENPDLLSIARDKAAAVKAKIDFASENFLTNSFDAVLADASFTRPADLPGVFKEAARFVKKDGKIIVFTPTAGSFGEIFSYLWEIFLNAGLNTDLISAERLVSEIPTVSNFEEIAASAGLKKIETQTSNEIFEYENATEFVNSPLVAEFLLPVWLESLTDQQTAQVVSELTKLINDEDQNLSFRFSVKVTLLTGENDQTIV